MNKHQLLMKINQMKSGDSFKVGETTFTKRVRNIEVTRNGMTRTYRPEELGNQVDFALRSTEMKQDKAALKERNKRIKVRNKEAKKKNKRLHKINRPYRKRRTFMKVFMNVLVQGLLLAISYFLLTKDIIDLTAREAVYVVSGLGLLGIVVNAFSSRRNTKGVKIFTIVLNLAVTAALVTFIVMNRKLNLDLDQIGEPLIRENLIEAPELILLGASLLNALITTITRTRK